MRLKEEGVNEEVGQIWEAKLSKKKSHKKFEENKSEFRYWSYCMCHRWTWLWVIWKLCTMNRRRWGYLDS